MTDIPIGSRRFIITPVHLDNLAHHEESHLPPEYERRLLYMSSELAPAADLFITARSIKELAAPAEPNVHPHSHEVTQYYLLFGEVEVEVEIEGARFRVQAPSSIFVPAGAIHSLRILKGTGTVLSIVRSGQYL